METYEREENKTDVKDDPLARELLRKAFEKTARWQHDFKGFTADLTVNINGKESRGTVTVKGPRDVRVGLSDPELQKWAEGQIAMIAVHRGPRSFEESDGKYALTLGEDKDHPMGPSLVINGDTESWPTSRALPTPTSAWPLRTFRQRGALFPMRTVKW